MVNKVLENNFGDCHNFGSQVHPISDSELIKPRMLYWEYLFLNKSSELNVLLNSIFNNIKASPLNCISSLKITIENDWLGREELLKLEPCHNLSEFELEEIGASIALWSWFGVIDLHKDNLKIGRKNGKLVFMPIDIESCFLKVNLLTDTLIVQPASKISIAGAHCLQFLIGELGNIEYISSSFSKTIDILNAHSKAIFNFINNNIVKEKPVRIILRPTRDYYSNNNSNFIEEEKVQLKRGDIPYFFTFWKNSEDIYYFSNPNEFKKVSSNLSSLYFLKNFIYSESDLFWPKSKTTIFLSQIIIYILKLKSNSGELIDLNNSKLFRREKNRLFVNLRDIGNEFSIENYND